jgi:hypothetical protein
MSAAGLDRPTILAAVMPTILAVRPDPTVDPDAVGSARILADDAGVFAGAAVAKEVFGRLGVRFRTLVEDGAEIRRGTVVGEAGGALAAIRGAAPVALTWLQRLSAVATGAQPPASGDPLDSWAAGLSRPERVRESGPSFRLEI